MIVGLAGLARSCQWLRDMENCLLEPKEVRLRRAVEHGEEWRGARMLPLFVAGFAIPSVPQCVFLRRTNATGLEYLLGFEIGEAGLPLPIGVVLPIPFLCLVQRGG